MTVILRRSADVVADLDSIVHSLCVVQDSLVLDDSQAALLKNRFAAAREALDDLAATLHRAAKHYEAASERQLPAIDEGRREGLDG